MSRPTRTLIAGGAAAVAVVALIALLLVMRVVMAFAAESVPP